MKLLYTALLLALSSAAFAQTGAHSPWEFRGPIKFVALAQQSQSTVVASTANGYLYFSNDFGNTWRHQCIDDTMQLGDIEFFDSLHGIVNATSGPTNDRAATIFLTEDGGATWSRIHVPLESSPLGSVSSTIDRLSFPSIDTFYACDEYGLVWSTTDKGQDWTVQRADTNWLNGIYFLDSKTGFIVGRQGCFSKTTDAGVTWTRQNIGAGDSTELYSMDFYNRSIGVVFGFGYSYLTTDGGTSWIYKPTPVAAHNHLYTGRWMNDHQFFAFGPSVQVYNVMGVNSDMTCTLLDSTIIDGITITGSVWNPDHGGLVVSYDGLVMRSPDGLQWNLVSEYDGGLNATFGNAWYSVGSNSVEGVLERSTDAGNTWRGYPIGRAGGLGVHFADSLHGIAFDGIRTASEQTSDGGLTWTNAGLSNTGPNAYVAFSGYTVFGTSTSNTTGDTTIIWKSTDNGRTFAIVGLIPSDWRNISPYPNEKPYGFRFTTMDIVDENTAYALLTVRDTGVGHDVLHTNRHALLYVTSDGGSSWNRVAFAPMLPAYGGIYFRDKNNGFIGCDSGALFRTTDGGVTWSRSFIPMSPGPHYVEVINFRDSLHGYLGTNDAPGIFATKDGGETWQNDSLDGGEGTATGFLFPDSNTVVAFAGGGGYYQRTITPRNEGSGVATTRIALSGLSIFPNPTTGILHIESISNNIIITDLLGRTCLRSISKTNDLDVSKLPQGAYSISDGHSRSQFVKE